MCLILPARVLGTSGDRVEVELHGGMRAEVGSMVDPALKQGDHVLVDRGFVIRVIDAVESAAILRMYDEIGDLLAGSDA